jgi:hypothetical protein
MGETLPAEQSVRPLLASFACDLTGLPGVRVSRHPDSDHVFVDICSRMRAPCARCCLGT